MIALDKFKKSLGKTAKTMTEEQILELREHQDKMAEFFFCDWIAKINKNKVELSHDS